MNLSNLDLRDVPISFPGLFGDWRFTASGKLLDIGSGVYWYGVLIALGVLLAVWFCSKQAPKYGLTEDNVFDVVLWAVPLGIVGARLYYIIFYYDQYRTASGAPDFGKMIRIWDGGLAIYGGVIVGFAMVFAYCAYKKIPAPALMDGCIAGLMIGQIVGRWGNFMNREAFGAETTLPWRMRLWLSAESFVDVHPTFLYESLWNMIGLLLLCLVIARRRRFDGENVCFYLLWYGLGRFWIEGLREDSLYLFDLTLFGSPVRVSQALSLALVLFAGAVLLARLVIRPADPQKLWINRARESAP